jgi:hypothetical protein
MLESGVEHFQERLAYYDFWALEVLVGVYVGVAESKVQAYHYKERIDEKELPLFGEW